MSTRRNFFAATTVAALSTSGVSFAITPAPAPAPLPLPLVPGTSTTTLKFQSAFSKADVRHKLTEQFASRFNSLGGGRVKIEVVPSGTFVSSFDLLDAVSSGKLDGGFSSPSNWHAKSAAISLWGSGPAFGLNSQALGAWHQYGGGKDLMAEVYSFIKAEVMSIPFAPVATQPLGWFKKPVTRIEDFKGLRFRTNGLAVDLFQKLGAEVKILESSQTIEAFKTGQLDGAEFNNLTTDRAIGLDKVAANCMLKSYHEASGILEVLINKKIWSALSIENKILFETIASSMFAESHWLMMESNSKDYDEMTRAGVKFFTTPSSVLQAMLNAWDSVISKKSAEDPLFAKVIKSQKEFSRRASRWSYDVEADVSEVHRHYFKRRVV